MEVGKIIPIPKPNKPMDQAKSYGPISLLSPVAKLVEKLIHPILVKHLKPKDHQHGFLTGYSNITALHTVTNHIQQGLNRKRSNHRSVLVALDLTSAFDTVNLGVLINQVCDSSLPPLSQGG